MFWHPMLLTVIMVDMMAIILVLSASKTAFHVLLEWNPQSAGRKQLRLEIAVEASSIKVRVGSWALFFSTIVLLVAIANVLPGVVPGAMCGTGVIQATEGMGSRALAFRLAAVFILFVRSGFEKLDQTSPVSSLVHTNAGLLLIALPLVIFSTIDTVQSISGLETQKPVDCCAALYDTVRSSQDVSVLIIIPKSFWITAYMAGGLLIMIYGLYISFSSGFQSVHATLRVVFISLFWVFVAAVTLVKILSSYHYQVLYHHCPWCLFLPQHHMVGYALFGALGATLFESTMIFGATKIASGYPEIRFAALNRIRKAGIHMVMAVILFLIISGMPAILWRLKYGVWIGG